MHEFIQINSHNVFDQTYCCSPNLCIPAPWRTFLPKFSSDRYYPVFNPIVLCSMVNFIRQNSSLGHLMATCYFHTMLLAIPSIYFLNSRNHSNTTQDRTYLALSVSLGKQMAADRRRSLTGKILVLPKTLLYIKHCTQQPI